MDSLDAQCYVVHLVEADDPAARPDRWIHGRDGSLTWAFAGSPNSYTWRSDGVDDIARRWRELGVAVPLSLKALVRSHRAFTAMLDAGDLDPPDRIEHDVVRAEVTAYFDEPGVAVVVTDDGAATTA